MGEIVGIWLFRMVCIVGGLTIITTVIKAFFNYIHEELALGPVPVYTFFIVGLLVALLGN